MIDRMKNLKALDDEEVWDKPTSELTFFDVIRICAELGYQEEDKANATLESVKRKILED